MYFIFNFLSTKIVDSRRKFNITILKNSCKIEALIKYYVKYTLYKKRAEINIALNNTTSSPTEI